MDNYTILITLIIILAVYVVFTIITSRNTGVLGRREWQLSSLCLFSGFLLITFQRILSPFISICVANYLLTLGFYYQTAVALMMDYKQKVMRKGFLLSVSLLYWFLFPFFTYISFNTAVRIIIISLFLVVFYFYAAWKMFHHYKSRSEKPFDTLELYLLFIYSAFFYLFRTLATAWGTGTVSSLFDMNLITTISFINIIVFNLIYMMGIFNASLRSSNHLLVREKDKLSSLFNFLNDTARHLNLDDLYKSIEEILKKSMHIDTAGIFLIDEDRMTHSMVYVFNNLELPLESVQTLKRGEGISGKAIEENRIVSMNMDQYPLRPEAERFKAKGVSELVSIPLRTADGIIGAITMVYTEERKNLFLDEDYVYYLGEQIALVLQNAFLYEKVTKLANTDPLTGLYNRRRMMEILRKEYAIAMRGGRRFTLVMADLDHFKDVNDSFGHDCGDEVLKQTSALFRKECREYDSLCRWGGEEFLLLFVDSDVSSTTGVLERVRKEMEHMKLSCIENRPVTLSMGVTGFDSHSSLEQLIAKADDALYRAKKNGRNRIEYSRSD
ncbi:MAG: sensor domain-containing diguanylate cyclase [Spirochaetales bacterium]|nr:sensor domain-containing diguanylate cyclase [Spirochaetales bacterium]